MLQLASMADAEVDSLHEANSDLENESSAADGDVEDEELPTTRCTEHWCTIINQYIKQTNLRCYHL